MQKTLTIALFFLLLVLTVSLIVFQTVEAQNKPLTYPEIITALNSRVPNRLYRTKKQVIDKLIKDVEKRKVESPLTAEIESLLLKSGASAELVQKIKENSPKLRERITNYPVPTVKPATPTPVKPTPTPTPSPTPTPAGTEKTIVIGMTFVWIPAGKYLMGSSEIETEKAIYEVKRFDKNIDPTIFNDEKPKREIHFTKGFWLGKFEVTQAQWMAVMNKNPSKFKNCGKNCPVESVSWNEVQIFIRKLNEMGLDFEFSLPTEAEWEYAARAGRSTAFAFGDFLTHQFGNFKTTQPFSSDKKAAYRKRTVPVETYTPNNWGIFQMHGNVPEWVQDIYNSNYLNLPTDGTANLEIGESRYRVVRGGSWRKSAAFCRSAARSKVPADKGEYNDEVIGLRIVARSR